MSKTKKKKKRYSAASHEEYTAARDAVKAQASAFNYRLALLMLGIFAALAIVYYILLSMQILWASPVLYTLAAVLFLTFFFVNGGFSRECVTREMLPDAWTETRKDAFIEHDRRRKALGRKLMIVMTPVLLLVIADMLILFVLPLFETR